MSKQMLKLAAELGKAAARTKKANPGAPVPGAPATGAPQGLPFRLTTGEGGGMAQLMPEWLRKRFGSMTPPTLVGGFGAEPEPPTQVGSFGMDQPAPAVAQKSMPQLPVK